MEKQTTNPKSEKTPIGSSTELVAGASTLVKWNYHFKPIRIHATQVIEYIQEKVEFTRLDLEDKFGIDAGKAYWHIAYLHDKKLIKKTSKKLHLGNKGRSYALYKYNEKINIM